MSTMEKASMTGTKGHVREAGLFIGTFVLLVGMLQGVLYALDVYLGGDGINETNLLSMMVGGVLIGLTMLVLGHYGHVKNWRKTVPVEE